MSTIFGMISLKHELKECTFNKMKDVMVMNNYKQLKNRNMMIATTEDFNKDGTLVYCGRTRYMDLLEEYEKKRDINTFDGHFVLIEKKDEQFHIYKDALGIEPFYYIYLNDILYFASEIKVLLCLKEKWVLNKEQILQVVGLLPSLDLSSTPYPDIFHLGPGQKLILTKKGLSIEKWWKIPNIINNKNESEIIEDIKKIVTKNILDDAENNSACMLSGGLDSSVITAVVANHQDVKTYDVIYEDNELFFKAYEYQTTMDQPYIEQMKNMYPINHTTIKLSQKQLVEHLKTVLLLRDLPGMVDIDSSLYLFSNEIAKNEKVILSGECADELFGGYPWFYKDELNVSYFPWNRHLKNKQDLLAFDIDLENYLKNKRLTTYDIDITNKKNDIMYLTMNWFMQTLVIRGDVVSRSTNLDIRMPFASKELFEYLWNVDEKYYFKNNKEKYLLREAFKNILPKEIYSRKKNPYPKTHSPLYTDLVVNLLDEALKDHQSILYKIFKKEKLQELIATKGDSFKYPWYGQLMTGPQLIAFIYTIHLWGKIYPIELSF